MYLVSSIKKEIYYDLRHSSGTQKDGVSKISNAVMVITSCHMIKWRKQACPLQAFSVIRSREWRRHKNKTSFICNKNETRKWDSSSQTPLPYLICPHPGVQASSMRTAGVPTYTALFVPILCRISALWQDYKNIRLCQCVRAYTNALWMLLASMQIDSNACPQLDGD